MQVQPIPALSDTLHRCPRVANTCPTDAPTILCILALVGELPTSILLVRPGPDIYRQKSLHFFVHTSVQLSVHPFNILVEGLGVARL